MLFHKFILTLSCVFALISSSWAQEGQQELMERATSGELQAQAELGAYYLYGWEGFQKNQTEGKKWLLKAAKAGHPVAQYVVASEYYFGSNGFEKNDVESKRWAQAAYDAGDYRAAVILSRYYVTDKNTQEEIQKGLSYLRDAAKHDDVDAMNALGRAYGMYYFWFSGESDKDEAAYWYEKARALGGATSASNSDLAEIYIRGLTKKGKETTPKGVAILEEEIKKDNVNAMNSLSFYYSIGVEPHLKQDIKIATDLRIQAARLGDDKALESLATNLLVDYQEEDSEINKMVVQHYKDQAEKSEKSNYDLYLGLWSYYGKFGMKKNMRLAETHFLKSFEKEKNLKAAEMLGFLYIVGEGVRYDPEKAIKFFTYASEKSGASAFSLGTIYADGLGVPRNATLAKEWFGKSCDLGLEDGCKQYKDFVLKQ